MGKIIIFAGTSEGRELALLLHRHQKPLHICVATRYGGKVLGEDLAGCITAGRLDAAQMQELFKKEEAEQVVDATHPYAIRVSENIRAACEAAGLPCLRLLRESEEKEFRREKDGIVVNSAEEAADYLKKVRGKALIAIGSKELDKFTEIEDYQKRLIARVLPTPEVLEGCRAMGFEGANLIAMQGPFSEELNIAMLRQTGASFLVTKESGKPGGFSEKIKAAKKAGARVILIRRPREERGLAFAEVVEKLCPEAVDEVKEIDMISAEPRKITLLGVGMGDVGQLTWDGIRACQNADVIIGSRRILDTLSVFGKPVFEATRSNAILQFIHENPQHHRVVVGLSGDVGFYSGAKKLLTGIAEGKAELICGVSTVSYFCARLGISWEDAFLVSSHGRKANLVGAIKEHPKVISLVGGGGDLRELCNELIEYGLGKVRLTIGENLSYDEERMIIGTPEELCRENFGSLCVLLAQNPAAKDFVVTHGIEDAAFIREKVPMTKEEVRSICLTKLRLTANAVVYDVGAGTGAVSVEAALQAKDGLVFAIDGKPQAAELVRRNARKFGTANLTVVEGNAPAALQNLPVPTHAFVGGSDGRLEEILNALRMKNPHIRIVVNAVSLETMSALSQYFKKYPVRNLDMVMIYAARGRELGDYHTFKGMTPVLVAAFNGEAAEQ